MPRLYRDMTVQGKKLLKDTLLRLPFVGELRNHIVGMNGRIAALESRLAKIEQFSLERAEQLGIEQEKQAALSAVSDFWRAYPGHVEPNRPPILVDLMHNDPEYLLRSLVIAKFCQLISGAPLIGILGIPGMLYPIIRSSYSPSDNVRMANSFEIYNVIEAPNTDADDNYERDGRSAIERIALQAPEGDALPPKAIAELRNVRTLGGFPIGKVVQETFMRGDREATVRAGRRLMHWTGKVFGFHSFTEQTLSTLRPGAFVTGHIDYCPWGHLAEALVRRGGRVVWYRNDSRLSMHVLDRIEQGRTLNGMVRQLESDSFKSFESKMAARPERRKRADSAAQAHFDSVSRGVGRNYRWVDPAADVHDEPIPLAGERPTYCLFTHTMTDQPNADESLFIDYLDWLEQTCQHAAECQSYNLLVKIHPLDRAYDGSNAVDRVAEAYVDAPNIHFSRNQIAPETILQRCVLGITVRGTPGIEMTARGLPMILAGRGAYSDAGFCMAPKTQSEYFSLLERGGPFPIDIAEQARRARLFSAFDRHWSPPITGLVPAFGNRRANDLNLWKVVAEGVRSTCLETDQGLRAMAAAWKTGHAKVVTREIEDLFEETA
jgi:hypothetical protein